MLVEKLGPVKKCDIELGQETILLGKNNSGKTYISYLLYGMYKRVDKEKGKFLEEFLGKLIDTRSSLTIQVDKSEISKYLIDKIVEDLNTNLIKDLPTFFNASQIDFSETKLKIYNSDFEDFLKNSLTKSKVVNEKISLTGIDSTTTLDIKNKEEYWEVKLEELDSFFDEDSDLDFDRTNAAFLRVAKLFFSRKIFAMPNILYIPAERNGINVFRKELSIKRSTKSFDINSESLPAEKYPLPISDYMKYLNRIDLDLADKYLDKEPRMNIWNRFSADILKGKYEYDSEQNEFYYREIYSTNKARIKYKQKKIPLQISSSSIKSLFGLEYYIKYLFSEGDILFIDEPEMNLDPENQTKFAGLLVELSNMGVKIIISSHSDYLIRSTTNKILNAKVNKEDINCKVMGYYFDDVNGVRTIGDLSKVEYIDIFDDINVKLEDEYFLLKNKLNQKDLN
ncbi:AAA family ATPase [Lysinibacillus sphaericus]|uniref:AAA family ATPase n=1 Tax=Lysinibacillus sphaericus TaxID=1421 RepID=UPI003805B4D3